MKPITLEIPMTSIISEANVSQHWTKRRKRRILQDKIVKWYWIKEKIRVKLPCLIKLTRIGRKMDYSNLVASLKFVQDTVADLILPGLPPGRADGDPRLKWLYDQKKGNTRMKKGLVIEISHLPDKPTYLE